MSAPTAFRLVARSLSSSNLSRCSRHHYLPAPARLQAWKTPSRRFAVSAKTLEKRYSEDHEWVELSDDGSTGTIGISDYAAKALGDVVFVELPIVGTEVGQGEAIGAVESVKSASDIMSPVSGTITEANNVLEEKPATINKSPEGEGWLAKISISNADEVKDLMDAEGYKAFTSE